METFFERLLRVTEDKGYKNINDFALRGLKYDSSSKLARLKHPNKKPSFEILEDIANLFEDLNMRWLLLGVGRMYSEGKKNRDVIFQNSKKTNCEVSPQMQREILAAQEKTITDRLSLFMKHVDINANQLTIKAGLSVGLLGKATIAASKGLSSETVQKIKKVFPELNLNWLLVGEGEIFNKSLSMPESNKFENCNVVNLQLFLNQIEELKRDKLFLQRIIEKQKH